ncbi:hypothetical protein C499_11196 [Halogeometricum borinquense DSM 11551]|uniref:Uncharacterized protein n=1 Tax=Halogeometricum borinquense (strain ATCC 700274 / DSM 11551 / JCM 10706 / KCTC 4070 / PR3) TaxID=469382 RepID=E4NS79_HALBP|nr:hypothetical protein Hbor_01530 [Halogeometricum borinquense DSM 11551]ELY26768.1 hypothetical protein C499_11196 [Halogeometricum borinquense DSM 11551]
MGKWFRLYTKIHTYQYAVLGIVGIVATIIFASPGTDFIHVGRQRLDVFYISLALFGALFVLSVTDEYSPEDYGLYSSKSEK